MRLALHWIDDSGAPNVVTDGDIEIFSVDERHPDDRVYKMGPGIERITPEQFDARFGGPVHQLGDKPEVEQAARAMMDRRPDGKAGLSIVKSE